MSYHRTTFAPDADDEPMIRQHSPDTVHLHWEDGFSIFGSPHELRCLAAHLLNAADNVEVDRG